MAFDTILVANRGEIALRVLRTIRRMGYRGVAVYSEADRDAPHVRYADVSVCLGPAESAESYLSVDKVIAAARASGAGAVHPGYGFLSENAGFAEACEEAGIAFIGPSASAIAIMGDKASAKEAMLAAGVPCVPGYQGKDQSVARLRDAASSIGYPVMLKAAAGGGGKGMRLVTADAEFDTALQLAKAEAEAAFGSSEMLLEKALTSARHVEIQVFADQVGNTLHLGERDCSVQRRHQKVLEEAPGPSVSPGLRERMGQSAVRAARAIGYVGAGTVEFLLNDNDEFYFLEMNTRLQVEHPVTEMVTGLDLVEWQIRAAEGQALPLTQAQVAMEGWAIEARLYAESPAKGFLPSSGQVLRLDWPEIDAVRVDAGIEEGTQISAHYDPMLAKLVAHGDSRDAARRKLIAALKQTTLFGVATNRDYLLAVLSHPVFAEGAARTTFIEQAGDLSAQPSPEALARAAAVLFLSLAHDVRPRLSRPAYFDLDVDGEVFPTCVMRVSDGLQVTVGEADILLEEAGFDGRHWRCVQDGLRQSGAATVLSEGEVWIAVKAQTLHARDRLAMQQAGEAQGSGDVTAPMHGRIVSVSVKAGQRVDKGEPLLVLEAMKMQHTLTAPMTGRVETLIAATGAQVETSQLLVTISEDVE